MNTVLLYNPQAGRNRDNRIRLVENAAEILERNGFLCRCEPTRTATSIHQQVRDAVQSGTKAIIACGGDGTIHNVLQGIVGSDAVLGTLPFGSANATAREIGLPKHALRAAAQLRPTSITSVQVALVRSQQLADRYFLSMAGAGLTEH